MGKLFSTSASSNKQATINPFVNTVYLFVFSPNAGKCGPDNSKYGHFSRSAIDLNRA